MTLFYTPGRSTAGIRGKRIAKKLQLAQARSKRLQNLGRRARSNDSFYTRQQGDPDAPPATDGDGAGPLARSPRDVVVLDPSSDDDVVILDQVFQSEDDRVNTTMQSTPAGPPPAQVPNASRSGSPGEADAVVEDEIVGRVDDEDATTERSSSPPPWSDLESDDERDEAENVDLCDLDASDNPSVEGTEEVLCSLTHTLNAVCPPNAGSHLRVNYTGNSRTTEWREMKKRKDLNADAQKNSQSLKNFFSVKSAIAVPLVETTDEAAEPVQSAPAPCNPSAPALFSRQDIAAAVPNFDTFSDAEEEEEQSTARPATAEVPRAFIEVPPLLSAAQIERSKAAEAAVRLWTIIEKGKSKGSRLQFRRISALYTYLKFYSQGMSKGDAARRAAEAFSFAPNWAPRQFALWAKAYIKSGLLPQSRRGVHPKVYSLLSEPRVKAELTAFVRSNKWSMDPKKLVEITRKVVATEAEQQWVQENVQRALPAGLLRYLNIELLPRLNYAAVVPISRRTACRWLNAFGFGYKRHFKNVYYDGHERIDVVKYRNESFIPEIMQHRTRLRAYQVGDVDVELEVEEQSDGQGGHLPPLVLVAHDASIFHANDDQAQRWVYKDEYRLKHKGKGRGLHASEFICSTVGHLKDAGHVIDMGNDGYWTGEDVVKQVREKAIPAFEAAHPRQQALFLFDDSSNHGTFAADALRAEKMNLTPGGKQPKMRNGWYINADGLRVSQAMCFPDDHPTDPGIPKGLRLILQERGLFHAQKKPSCSRASDHTEDGTCCHARLLSLQPDFQEQRSLLHETIAAAGHLCIFLPKFHCELNPVEFFWGAAKQYARAHCNNDYTHLETVVPEAMANVSVQSIRRWEHRMWRWIEAYRDGLSVVQASFAVKQYKSHRRIPQNVADQI